MEDKFLQVVDNLLQVGRTDEVIKQCLQWLASEPTHYGARVYLVRAHFKKGEYDKADQAATAIIKLAPDEPFGYYLKSLACHNLNRFNSELEMAEQAARLDPEDENYLQRLAEAQLQQGQVKKAKATARQLVNLAPDSEEAHELFGRICLQVDDFKNSEEHYRAALQINPNATYLLNNLALALEGQKKLNEAIEVLFNALKLNPNDEALRYNTFLFIKKFIDQHSLKGRRKKALASLPTPIQMFYEDMKQRSSVFERFSNHTMMAMWLAFFMGFVLLLSLFSQQ